MGFLWFLAGAVLGLYIGNRLYKMRPTGNAPIGFDALASKHADAFVGVQRMPWGDVEWRIHHLKRGAVTAETSAEVDALADAIRRVPDAQG